MEGFPDMTERTAISTAGLTKHYPGVAALSDLNLDIPAGSIYGFLGPNGAGKSTAIKLLAGLTRPTSGTASVAGIPITAGDHYRREVGYLAQEPRFYPWMTGRDTLRFVSSLYPPQRRSNDKAIGDILGRVGLADTADRKAGTYSGGMRQRLGIAQALVGRPSVLLLDEPVSSLDPIGRREVLELMQALKGETTVFYSTHILDDVERVSDYVAILDEGKLIRAEPTAQLLGSFTKNRLSVVLSGANETTVDALKALPGVDAVDVGKHTADLYAYVLTVAPDKGTAVQKAITRYAAQHDITVTENHVVTLGLEDVFLRLVHTKEHAA
jgi:ABC-2 type transport system ATP-binding protein